MPTGFTEDKWVTEAEVRPGNRVVTHHVIAFVREPGSKWMSEAAPGVPFVPKKRVRKEGERAGNDDAGGARELLVGYAPGMAATDRTRIGLVFAKEPPRERVFTANTMNTKFVIPPGDSNYRVDAQITLAREARLVDLMPHMHLRGKDFEFRLVYPDGRDGNRC